MYSAKDQEPPPTGVVTSSQPWRRLWSGGCPNDPELPAADALRQFQDLCWPSHDKLPHDRSFTTAPRDAKSANTRTTSRQTIVVCTLTD